MHCLIIAAGHGSRLRDISHSKPLTPVAGVALIERAIRAAAAGGATRFTVVTGHEAERVEAFLAGLGEFAIESVRVADWDVPNGHSVLEDHYEAALTELINKKRNCERIRSVSTPVSRDNVISLMAALTLAVDRDLTGPLLDMDDATKVETGPGGEIVRIGKTLARFDAIDTGLFRATLALAEAIGEGGGSLSDGVQRLADRGLAATADVTGLSWLDVDDPAALAKAEAMLAAL